MALEKTLGFNKLQPPIQNVFIRILSYNFSMTITKKLYKIFAILLIIFGIGGVGTLFTSHYTSPVTAAVLIFIIFFGGGYYLWRLSEEKQSPEK